MIRREPDLLHPRLTVVPIDDRSRPAIGGVPGQTVVGRAELAEATEVVAERRRAALRTRIAELAAELATAEVAQREAEATVEQRRADRDGFLDAAAWCESLPDAAHGHRAAVARAETELAERLRESREAARALDRVLEQRAQADAAISEARRQLRALEAGAADPTGERQQAASALAAQAESVEARLTEAEAGARARSEQSKRAVTESERALDELARDQRDRDARLRALVDCLPGDARPPHDDDPIHHVATIAGGLRAIAATVDGELAGLGAVADRQQADCKGRRADLDNLRRSLERIAPEDAAQALADLVTGIDAGVVVLDDVVATADGGTDDSLLRALEGAEPAAPLVLLSSDPTVLGWAIDLPADRGALAGPRTVDLLTAAPVAAMSCPTTALPSMGDHR